MVQPSRAFTQRAEASRSPSTKRHQQNEQQAEQRPTMVLELLTRFRAPAVSEYSWGGR